MKGRIEEILRSVMEFPIVNIDEIELDSISLIKFVIGIEDEFDIIVPDEVLLDISKSSIDDICTIIMKVINEDVKGSL